jgi:hypothetical protein
LGSAISVKPFITNKQQQQTTATNNNNKQQKGTSMTCTLKIEQDQINPDQTNLDRIDPDRMAVPQLGLLRV